MKIYFTLITLLLSVVGTASAAISFPSSGGGGAKMGFFGSVAIKGSLGTASSKDEEFIASRDFYVYGAEATLGLRWGMIMIGASGEYNLWKQKTKPSEVDDTNLSGKQLNLSPVLGFGLGPFLLQAKTPMYSTMTLDKKDASDNEVVYTVPSFPAYTVQLNYKLGSSTYVGLEYTSMTYEKAKIGGEEEKLDKDYQPTFSSYGLVYGLVF